MPGTFVDLGDSPEFYVDGLAAADTLGSVTRFAFFGRQPVLVGDGLAYERRVKLVIFMPNEAIPSAIEIACRTLETGGLLMPSPADIRRLLS